MFSYAWSVPFLYGQRESAAAVASVVAVPRDFRVPAIRIVEPAERLRTWGPQDGDAIAEETHQRRIAHSDGLAERRSNPTETAARTGCGALRLPELSPARTDRFIRDRCWVPGISVAKLCRSRLVLFPRLGGRSPRPSNVQRDHRKVPTPEICRAGRAAGFTPIGRTTWTPTVRRVLAIAGSAPQHPRQAAPTALKSARGGG